MEIKHIFTDENGNKTEIILNNFENDKPTFFIRYGVNHQLNYHFSTTNLDSSFVKAINNFLMNSSTIEKIEVYIDNQIVIFEKPIINSEIVFLNEITNRITIN